MNKTLILTLSILFLGKVVQAQEAGMSISFNYGGYLGSDIGSGKMLGIRASYEQVKEQFGRSGSWRSGFQLSFGNYNDNFHATKLSSSGFNAVPIPDEIEVNGATNYKSIQFELAQKMYFGNGNMQYGGFYLLAGFGFNVVKREVTYELDDLRYFIDDPKEKPSNTFSQLTANVGAGYEYYIEVGNLFIESDFNLPFLGIGELDLGEFEFGELGHKSFWLSAGIRINMF